ncbi:unnamed protein product [Prorocentrum cordatum]|uniref:Armadillo repeat-containing protein 8 n=1 Tax=Prorocentrum cordatum TaxID=2364126 RepID=A0ABN9TEX4_9DINO|nr:unnamed protein product [Polarella glacialis]
MSAAAVAIRIRSALSCSTPSSKDLAAVTESIPTLRPDERLQLVMSNTWGELIVAHLPDDNVFKLLHVLSDLRPPPPARDRFFSSFDMPGLCEACAEKLRVASSKPMSVTMRLCVRNLARYPVFRLRLSGAVPILAQSLLDREVDMDILASSAAALCNLCCDNTLKVDVVRLGVVPALLSNLKRSPKMSAAEDLVACLGVLIAGYPPGVEALFNTGGDAGILVECLCSSHPALQTLAAEILADVCSCSRGFTTWLVSGTELLGSHLGRLLSLDGDPRLLGASLNLCERLAEAEEFAKEVQKGHAVQALQAIAELPADPRDPQEADARRPPTKQEQARGLLGRILFF